MQTMCKCKKGTNCYALLTPLFYSDLGRIQTFNLLSRNQVRYSVAPRGLLFFLKQNKTHLFRGANIFLFTFIQKYFQKNMLDLEDYIRIVTDFPKRGVVFKDITPLLGNKDASALCLEKLVELVADQQIDKVVGIESRGFFFGMLLAQKLNAGFVPVRKPGKLPFDTLKEPYQLEYGMDVLEIHEDSIQKGDRILIHDDVLATGGTAKAACNLVEKLGGKIVQCNFIMNLDFLNGRSKLKRYPVASVLTY